MKFDIGGVKVETGGGKVGSGGEVTAGGEFRSDDGPGHADRNSRSSALFSNSLSRSSDENVEYALFWLRSTGKPCFLSFG